MGSGIRGDDGVEEGDHIFSYLHLEWVYAFQGNMPTNFGAN